MFSFYCSRGVPASDLGDDVRDRAHVRFESMVIVLGSILSFPSPPQRLRVWWTHPFSRETLEMISSSGRLVWT